MNKLTLGLTAGGLVAVLAGIAIFRAHSGTVSKSAKWDADLCNKMFAGTLDQIASRKKTIDELEITMESAKRRGDMNDVKSHEKSIESFRTNGIAGSIKYLDSDLIPHCNKSKIKPEYLTELESVRKFLTVKEPEIKAEGMPDVIITDIKSEFIPFETDDKGSCSGPFLNLFFTVSNRGADFPRQVDLRETESRMKPPLDKLNFLTVVTDMDFGNKEISQKLLPVDRSKFQGDKLGSGANIRVPIKLKVENNQTKVHISAKVEGGSFLKTGNDGTKYETDIDIPIWDIYTDSNSALSVDGDDGKPGVSTKTKITNKGKSRTPGPVEGFFSIKYTDDGPTAASWDGKTEAAIDPGSGSEILNKKSVPVKIEDKFLVESTVLLLCPDGNPGNLSDGNFENNKRTLHQ